MSPLTSHVSGSVRRGGGSGGGSGGGGGDSDGGGELSFVFGRPATPDAAVVGRRTVSASASASGQVVVEREVLSPPPTSSLSSWVPSEWCQTQVILANQGTYSGRVELVVVVVKRNGSKSVRLEGLEERLAVPDTLRQRYSTGRCHVCETQVAQLKGEAIAMIRSIQLAQSAATSITSTSIPALVGSCSITPQQHREVVRHRGPKIRTKYVPKDTYFDVDE
nr:hypothetical protein BaRGS_031154 [Batillaria attramentaria]